VCEGLKISERRACKALGQHRSTQRHQLALRDDEDALTAAVIGLARSFGRYGYKRITGLLQMAGWNVNAKRVQRIWRSEGLKVPAKQPKHGRLWLADGSCIRLRSERRNHVWAYDFVAERTHDGRPLKLLTVVDEYTRECLAIVVARRIRSHEVLMTLSGLFLEYGLPEHIRSDNGPEFVAKAVREWLSDLGVTTLFIEPGSPWENGYIESFNGKLRDELLNGEILSPLKEAQILVANWRRLYNGLRPHSSLGQRPPAPESIVFPGFSLSDFAPPNPTREVALGPT
jgi:putative transposase